MVQSQPWLMVLWGKKMTVLQGVIWIHQFGFVPSTSDHFWALPSSGSHAMSKEHFIGWIVTGKFDWRTPQGKHEILCPKYITIDLEKTMWISGGISHIACAILCSCRRRHFLQEIFGMSSCSPRRTGLESHRRGRQRMAQKGEACATLLRTFRCGKFSRIVPDWTSANPLVVWLGMFQFRRKLPVFFGTPLRSQPNDNWGLVQLFLKRGEYRSSFTVSPSKWFFTWWLSPVCKTL